MIRWATIFLFLPVLVGASSISYDDSFFKENYSRILRSRTTFPAGTPFLKPETSKSPSEYAQAVIYQTDPVKVPYDQEKAYIEISGDDVSPLYIEVKYFRSVWVSWATDRILVIHRDIGHVAGMEEVIDVVDRRWLSQKAVFYRAE